MSMKDGAYSRSFPPAQAGIVAASEFLDEAIGKLAERNARLLSLSPSLHVILDEICSNIVRHSGASAFEIDIEAQDSPPGVKMAFIDDGVEYNPLMHADPDTTLPVEERAIGGLGIMMVKKMSSSVSYHHVRGRNIFDVTVESRPCCSGQAEQK